MTRRNADFLWQAGALVLAFLLVHGFYVLLVRPQADAVLREQAALLEADPSHVQERSPWVVIRDYEQEACFVLFFWALAIMGSKALELRRERGLLDEELLPLGEGTRILPEDTREFTRHLRSLDRSDQLLPRALVTGLQRFSATRSIQAVSTTAQNVCEAEGDRLESELSMVRYIAWAIPSIGFLGTVRGIGEALGQAHQAVEGEIAGVTRSLGVAFNSTFVALLLSIVLMFLLHQLQRMQEGLVLETEAYVDEHLVERLQVPGGARTSTP